MSLQFTKMQALGNDFVVINATKAPFALNTQQIQRMGDRRYGVGFDQLLLIEPAKNDQSDFYYRIFNVDGSEVGQCGNGARCVALYIKSQGMIEGDQVILQTNESRLVCQILDDGQVAVTLAPPKFDPADIPFEPDHAASVNLEFGVVNVGNPHAIILVDEVDKADLSAWGELLNDDPRFPEGVNVSVMSVESPDHVHLRVFERGVGKTEACGSAACAAMAYGSKNDLLGKKVTVSQPGGDLSIDWQASDSSMKMTGSAEFVFRGEWLLL